ncbi:MAG: hypothetical protein ACREJ2_14615 [Planctomycetota bacterium]
MTAAPALFQFWKQLQDGGFKYMTGWQVQLQATGSKYLFVGKLPPHSGIENEPVFPPGFEPGDCLASVPAGVQLYCIANERVGNDLWTDSVSTGKLIGSVAIGGDSFYSVAIPFRPCMAGAPVVTATGQWVGLMYGPLPDNQANESSLVVPIGIVQHALANPADSTPPSGGHGEPTP